MRILEEKQCQCSCGAQLAFTEEDIHYNDGDEFIVCPRCQNRINLVDCEPTMRCGECDTEFKASPYIGAFGAKYVKCPRCGNEEWYDDGIELTKTNIAYPQHFFHFKSDGKQMSDGEITKWVRECVSKLNQEDDFYIINSGNTLCIALKTDDEATVFVCKEVAECNLDI